MQREQQKLVIEGNAFYELDLECLRRKKARQEEAKKKKQQRQRR